MQLERADEVRAGLEQDIDRTPGGVIGEGQCLEHQLLQSPRRKDDLSGPGGAGLGAPASQRLSEVVLWVGPQLKLRRWFLAGVDVRHPVSDRGEGLGPVEVAGLLEHHTRERDGNIRSQR